MAGTAGAFIGLDLGTSGLKGVAVTASGAVLARGSAAYPTRRPAPGASEQAPADWIAAAEAVAAQLAAEVPVRRWRGIGLSAMIPTLVTAGADGEPNGPAVTWQDSRGDARGDELRERCGGEALYRRTGQWVDGRYLLPMFLRVADEEPGRAAATAWLLAAKDYLFGWLTGEFATDPSTATGFGCYQLEAGGWDAGVIAAAGDLLAAPGQPAPGRPAPGRPAPGRPAPGRPAPGRPASGRPALDLPAAGLPALPPVLPSATCRPLREEAAARLGCGRIPVCLGAADSVLGALGLGVRRPGQVAYIAGTSNVIMGVAGRLVTDPEHRFLVTPLAEPGQWGLEMDLLATGSAIRWLAGLLAERPADGGEADGANTGRASSGGADSGGADTGGAGTGGAETGGADTGEAALVALAAGVDPRDAPLVLPYLSPGEQGALWDPLLHGTFVGLELGHGRRHLARGLVNGIVLESRRCLAVLDETGDFGRELEVAGSSAADPAFRANLADATRRRVAMPGDHDTDYSARGAALLAVRGIEGEWPPPALSIAGPAAEPDATRSAMWDAIWADYEHARLAISAHYHSAG